MPCEIEQAVQSVEQPPVSLPAGVPPLSALFVYAAGSCNLACRHCWIVPKYQPNGDGGPYIELEHIRKAIREAKPLGLTTIKLSGGEPMLHPRFRELIALIDQAGLDIILETNGTLIDDMLARFLRDTPHLRFISISVDGATAETHDELRSVPGSYERAVRGIKNLVDVGFRPQLICTLHRGNAAEMGEVVALAERLGCGSVKFNHVQRVGRGAHFGDKQGLELEAILQLYRHLEKEIVPRSKIDIAFDVPFAFRPIRSLLADSFGRCAVMNILGVLAGGELSLCGIGVTISELVYGNIEKDDLREIWCHNPKLARLREQVPAALDGICGQCLHRDFCQGECIANNFHTAGRLNAPYYFCDQAEALGLFPVSRKKTAH